MREMSSRIAQRDFAKRFERGKLTRLAKLPAISSTVVLMRAGASSSGNQGSADRAPRSQGAGRLSRR